MRPRMRDRSMSLDIYVWLAWRCHQLGKPTAISWPGLAAGAVGKSGNPLNAWMLLAGLIEKSRTIGLESVLPALSEICDGAMRSW